jgi:phosphoserine phosphatase RsbU/P
MSDKPAAYQLGIYISAVFIVVFSIFASLSFIYNRNLIHKNVENNAIAISTKIIGAVNEKILIAQEISTTLAQQIPYINKVEGFSQVLNNIAERYEFLTAIQVNYQTKSGVKPDSSVTHFIEKKHGQIFDEKVYRRNCQSTAMANTIAFLEERREPAWSKPYICPIDSDLVVLFYKPFLHVNNLNDSIYEGYVACEISLDFLNNLILETKISDRGYAFLIAHDGIFITHPFKEYILKRSLFNLPKKVFRGDESELLKFVNEDFGSITVYPTVLNFAKSIAYHTRMRNTGWVLATTIPYSEINRELYWLLFEMIVAMLTVVTTIFVSIFFISSKVMRPLSNVTREIHTFSNENSGYELQVRNEAEALTHSLKRLRKTYEKFRLDEAESKEQSQRFQRDLLMASEIQKSIIPPQGLWKLNTSGISLFSVFRPANVVSGDLYDFFMIDEKHLLITIGDASGSGVPAALFMGVAHTFIKSFSTGKSARLIVRKVNKELCRNNGNQFFLTLFLCILNIEDGTLCYCNAGHTPPYLIRSKGKLEILSISHGIPVGLYPERTYDESVVHLNPGDKLVLYTDGVTDQTNEAGQYFGEEYLRNIIRLNRNELPEDLAGQLLQNLDKFKGNSQHHDDVSILVFKYDNSKQDENVSLTG